MFPDRLLCKVRLYGESTVKAGKFVDARAIAAFFIVKKDPIRFHPT